MTPGGRRLHPGFVPLVLLVAAACGGEARMEIELRPEDRFPGLALEVEDGLGTRHFTRDELALGERGELATGSFEVAEEGTIRVSLRLRDGDVEVADGVVRIEAREEFRWGVTFGYATEDPTRYCFGCRGVVEIPVAESYRTSPDEAIWAWWGGRREGSDVVY